MRGLGFQEYGIILLVPILIYGIVLWILWKFYHAFTRIGEELSEIKTILRDRQGGAGGPPA